MLTNEENIKLANLLFPDVIETREDLEKKYPQRTNSITTRFAPSPTGFFHIWGVYQCFVHDRVAHTVPGWVFFLRIEDTDQEREVEGAIDCMITGLKKFGITVDEWPIGPGYSEVWDYGPYIQSKRIHLYHVMAKQLISEWKAYPCFLAEDEITQIREEQNLAKRVPGIYGSYATWREKSFEDYKMAIEWWKTYVIRLKPTTKFWDRIKVTDELRGVTEMDDNYLDVVVLKKDGIPTYHFAHAVDDHFMRVSIVIRAEEWFPSLPLHYQLFDACGFERMKYLHTAQLMKLDNWNKRKLSKRHDPESNVEYFFEQGYIVDAVMDYIGNILDSGYESWKKENLEKTYRNYVLDPKNMPKSGALFDLVKLNSINKEYVSAMSHEDFYQAARKWASEYDTELFALMEKYPDLTKAAMNIERLSEKDPKRFIKISDVKNQLLPFYPETFAELRKDAPSFSESISPEVRIKFFKQYSEEYNQKVTKEEWFEHLKNLWYSLGFARNNEEFKAWGFIGKTGDLAMMLRIALYGAASTPDLWETMRVLGKETVSSRLLSFC